MDVLSFVQSQRWKFRKSGEELEVGCPFEDCPNYEQPQFYINTKTEKWNCKRCGQGGVNLKQLEFKLGLVELRDPIKSQLYITEREVTANHKALINNPEAMEYLTNKRMLKLPTIKQFKLGYVEKEKFDNYEGPAIVHYDSFKGTYCNAEYHFFKKEGSKNKKLKSGSRSQLINLDRIDMKNPVYVTEGRYDMMAGWQYGYKNIGSVPNGADSADGEWTEEIKHAPKFLICSDADAAGFVCADKFSKKVGRTKCYRVHLEVKDLNEYLIYGIPKADLDRVVNNAEPLFAPPVSEIGQYAEGARELLEDPTMAFGTPTEWKGLNEIIGGIRMGELTTICGRTGQGKTTFALALATHMVKQGEKVLIISPEMKEEKLLLRLAASYKKKQIENHEELLEFTTNFQDKVYIAKVFNTWTDRKENLAEKVFDVMQHAVNNKGVKFIVLDHLRLFAKPRKADDNERLLLDSFVGNCVDFVIANDVHILLVAQPRKKDESSWQCKTCQKPFWSKITIDDLKGSSNIEQDSHNVLLIHRYLKKYCNCKFKVDDTIVEVEVAKNREFGALDTALLKFNLASNANFYEVK